MSERFAFYRCETCGNLVQVFISGEGELVCCGKPMTLLQPHKNDEFANEKHVPVFLEDSESSGTKIQVGAIPHPMEDNHYIQFIEAVSKDDKYLCVKFLEPTDEPIKNLHCSNDIDLALGYCNLHGLWVGDKKERDNDD